MPRRELDGLTLQPITADSTLPLSLPLVALPLALQRQIAGPLPIELTRVFSPCPLPLNLAGTGFHVQAVVTQPQRQIGPAGTGHGYLQWLLPLRGKILRQGQRRRLKHQHAVLPMKVQLTAQAVALQQQRPPALFKPRRVGYVGIIMSLKYHRARRACQLQLAPGVRQREAVARHLKGLCSGQLPVIVQRQWLGQIRLQLPVGSLKMGLRDQVRPLRLRDRSGRAHLQLYLPVWLSLPTPFAMQLPVALPIRQQRA